MGLKPTASKQDMVQGRVSLKINITNLNIIPTLKTTSNEFISENFECHSCTRTTSLFQKIEYGDVVLLLEHNYVMSQVKTMPCRHFLFATDPTLSNFMRKLNYMYSEGG